MARIAIGGLALAVALLLCQQPVAEALAGWPLARWATLAALGLIGVVIYGAVVLIPIGWRLMIMRP
jgi:hypothetical protein